jgi:prepilin-type N-terminal cleavage/methylation domain-containing protein
MYARRRKRISGFTLLEVVLAVMIFSAMAMMFAAAMPLAARSVRYGNDWAQASSLVMHKINQLQEAGYTAMTGPGLGQSGAGIVDGTPTAPSTNANGNQSGSFEFTTTDNLATYFQGGSSADTTKRPRGYLTIAPYTPSLNSATSVYSMIQATVRIVWTDARGRQQSFALTTLVPRTPVL